MASYYKSMQSMVDDDVNKWLDQIEAEKQVIRQNPQGYTPMSNQQLEGLANRYGVDTGSLYTGSKSSQYSPYGTSGADQWFNGIGTQDVIAGLQADYERYKAAGDVAGMNEAHTLAEQIRARSGYSGGTDGSMHISVLPYQEQAGIWNESLYGTKDPLYGMTEAEVQAYLGTGGYGSQYGSRIDAMLDAVLNRGPFSYNKDEDPLYQQYKESYTRAGNRAMQDTLAQVSARTGGLASSYGTSASQQTYNNYMAQLADKVPELYQMAYDMYLDEIAQKRADLDMLMGVDNMYYDRYRDDVADQQWQQQFDYNAGRDAVADSQWQTQWNYGVQSDQQALAQSQIDAILAAGGTPSAELIQMAGYSNDYVGAMGDYYRQAATPGYQPVEDEPTMSFTTAKDAAENGVLDEEVLDVLRANGYTDNMLMYMYGWEPDSSVAGGEDDTSGLLSELDWMQMKAAYDQTGKGNAAVANYRNYADYKRDYLEYMANR